MPAPDAYPLISVVICTRNRPQDIALCLPTVLGCDYPDFDVVLVDQSTDEETARLAAELKTQFPRLDYVRTGTVGKSIALNLGIARAQGEILAFTDDDCEVPTGWLSAIAREFAAEGAADVIFGPVLPSPSLSGLPDICVPSWAFSEARDLRSNEVCGMGANMALHRRVLASETGTLRYDALLGPGAPFPAAEEGDFCYRLRRSGARAALRPSLSLYHRAYRTADFWQKVIHGYGMGDAAFHVKHARSGDLWGARAILQSLLRFGARALVKTILRRKNHDVSYVRGYWSGLSLSRRYHVNRGTRMFTQPQESLAPIMTTKAVKKASS